MFEASVNGFEDAPPGNTVEEDAFNVLLGAHHDLSEALKQHDDLERQAVDELEMREVRERSKKDTRMDRMVSDAHRSCKARLAVREYG